MPRADIATTWLLLLGIIGIIPHASCTPRYILTNGQGQPQTTECLSPEPEEACSSFSDVMGVLEAGDIISVGRGHFFENGVEISKDDVTIVGEFGSGAEPTVVVGAGGAFEYVFATQSNNLTLRHLTIRNSFYGKPCRCMIQVLTRV